MKNVIKIFFMLCAFVLINGNQSFSWGISEMEDADAELDAELKWLQAEAIVVTENDLFYFESDEGKFTAQPGTWEQRKGSGSVTDAVEPDNTKKGFR
ncbi:hypothetical protein [Desulfonema magnum]|nr:hypothetical protein [Desulfonema magnum]